MCIKWLWRRIYIVRFQQLHQKEYPWLYTIALDYLTIQASSVPCEHVFSSAGETDTKKRNWLSPQLMEALQVLKFIYKKERLRFTRFFPPTPERTMLDNNVDLGDLFNADKEAEMEATDRMLSVCSLDDSVRGTPFRHAFPSRTLLLLPTPPPPSDASSAFRCIFRLPHQERGNLLKFT